MATLNLFLTLIFRLINTVDKDMEKLLTCSLAIIVAAYLMKGVFGQCQWSGFGGCACNILGACDSNGNLKPGINPQTLDNYAPSGLEIFSEGDGLKRNLAYLCEGGTVAIMYDCNKRIALYAATMMEGAQLNGGNIARPSNFKRSHDQSLDPHFQQNDKDYHDCSNTEICYDTIPKARFVDALWYNALNVPKTMVTDAKCDQMITNKEKIASIHRGHLIAARYGRGIPARVEATFTYTNVVPQFGKFNSGKWNSNEADLLLWGQNYCAKYNGKATKNAKMYIIVGAIPSTFPPGSGRPRYFGSASFSAFITSSYRVNVPSKLWTAACCIFQFQDNDGSWKDGTKHTAFWRDNNPGKEQCDKAANINQLFDQYQKTINLFPAHPGCFHTTNYVSLY